MQRRVFSGLSLFPWVVLINKTSHWHASVWCHMKNMYHLRSNTGGLQKHFFWLFRPQFGLKINGAGVGPSPGSVTELITTVVLIFCVSFPFQVLVVDAGGSLRCGMLGDNLAAIAVKNNWAGVLMYGCIRDSEEIGQMKLGVRALGTMPLKSIKKGQGERDITVRFAGVNFTPGHYVYSDLDGIIVSPKELTLPPPKLWFLLKDNDFSRNK